jgi:hypothetical protein
MRIALVVLCCFLVACAPEGSTAPVIAELEYAPMELTVGVAGSLDGFVQCRDADGDLRQIVLGLIDPTNALAEAPPQLTGTTDGMLVGRVAFRMTVTPMATGTHYLSVRLVDAQSQSSEAVQRPVEVR